MKQQNILFGESTLLITLVICIVLLIAIFIIILNPDNDLNICEKSCERCNLEYISYENQNCFCMDDKSIIVPMSKFKKS